MRALKTFLDRRGHGAASLIARYLDVQPSTVTRWRDGVWIPTIKTRRKLLDFIAAEKKSLQRKP